MTIAAEREKSWTITSESSIPATALRAVVNRAYADGDLVGVYFTQDSIEPRVDAELLDIDSGWSNFEEDDTTAIVAASAKDRNAFSAEVWEVVRASEEWAEVNETDRGTSAMRDLVDSAVTSAMPEAARKVLNR